MQVTRSGTLAAGNATVGNNLASLSYFHHDHQGSTIAVTKEVIGQERAVIERMAHLCVSYPWGKRRNVNGLEYASASDSINGLTTDSGLRYPGAPGRDGHLELTVTINSIAV